MKAPEMARKIGDVLDSLEAITETEVAADPTFAAASSYGASVDRMRARVRAERELLRLHGGEHVCADPGMPWLATPYESERWIEAEDVTDGGPEACWTLRWLARAHQVIAFPAADAPPIWPATDDERAAYTDLAKAGGMQVHEPVVTAALEALFSDED